MKKLIYAAGLSLGLSLLGISSSAFASESVDSPSNKTADKESNVTVEESNVFSKTDSYNLVESNKSIKRSIGTEHPTPYSQITTYSDGSVTGVDFSEATFYDEAGNVIEPPIDSDTDLITPFGDGTSGGSWSNGSGYSCAKGVKVWAGTFVPLVEMNFKADFCTMNGAYDEISRVYSSSISAYYWSPLSEGVFRSKETLEYSAYGGLKAQIRHKEGGNLKTEYVYLRVGNDSYWVDSSF